MFPDVPGKLLCSHLCPQGTEPVPVSLSLPAVSMGMDGVLELPTVPALPRGDVTILFTTFVPSLGCSRCALPCPSATLGASTSPKEEHLKVLSWNPNMDRSGTFSQEQLPKGQVFLPKDKINPFFFFLTSPRSHCICVDHRAIV